MPTAIQVQNLSKAYQLGEFSTGTISKDIERWWYKLCGKEDPFLKIGEVNDRASKGNSDIVWSLKDINFEIKQGDAIGIIGRNGAGKSTLLKILSRVTSPTTGDIKVKGRIASLLEVGTGFHPELTGRENIFLNGAILGMRKKEIARKFDEIVDFSGVERYIDTPVKRYSSGMYVRLAFAVAAHLESEILIVDEVLAVGDAEFQKKCLGKMDKVSRGEGRTVLFVSHSMASIKQLCNNCILLDKSKIRLFDKTDSVICLYNQEGINKSNIKYYDNYLRYVKVEQHGPFIEIDAEYDNTLNFEIPHLGIIINNSYGQPIFATNPTLEQIDTNTIKERKKGRIMVKIEHPKLMDGQYTASIWFGNGRKDFIEDFECLSFAVNGMTEKPFIPQIESGYVIPHTIWTFY